MPSYRSQIMNLGAGALPATLASFTISAGVVEFGGQDCNLHLIVRRTSGASYAVTGGLVDIYGYYNTQVAWVRVQHLTHSAFSCPSGVWGDVALSDRLLGYPWLAVRQTTGAALDAQLVGDLRNAAFAQGGAR